MDRTPVPLLRDVIGRLLRVRRIALGLTLADVADRAGISTQYLSEVERGLKDASSEMVAAIAGALGMQLHEVLVLSSRLVAPVDDERVRAVSGGTPTTLSLSSPLSSAPSLSTALASSSLMRGDVVLAA
ncbi:Helix-turn-helix domain-containing protein [Brevibacterium sp. Mu109]|uniref:helix-turn-helix domain-containing protein n=1 Tax=Brevibacterium sp. Mu109 TaxID=1255669 RepID=UPI000C52917A|nr:helix-turn-helix transcriptional regulator [Brevibacterium sp. Mu109]SMX65044.1 Helix-turn-helix domain-containing protein [Brevibacterium sp. Mu109]